MVFDILKFVFICFEVVLIFNLLIVVHELGHFLGLAHNAKDRSVMNATLNHGQVRRTLDDKDLESLNCEYKSL